MRGPCSSLARPEVRRPQQLAAAVVHQHLPTLLAVVPSDELADLAVELRPRLQPEDHAAPAWGQLPCVPRLGAARRLLPRLAVRLGAAVVEWPCQCARSLDMPRTHANPLSTSRRGGRAVYYCTTLVKILVYPDIGRTGRGPNKNQRDGSGPLGPTTRGCLWAFGGALGPQTSILVYPTGLFDLWRCARTMRTKTVMIAPI